MRAWEVKTCRLAAGWVLRRATRGPGPPQASAHNTSSRQMAGGYGRPERPARTITRPEGAARHHRAGGATPAGCLGRYPLTRGCAHPPHALRAAGSPARVQPGREARRVKAAYREPAPHSSPLQTIHRRRSPSDPRESPGGPRGPPDAARKPPPPRPALSVLGAGASTAPRSVFPGRAAAGSTHASSGSAGCPQARG
ncbi:hypothetical protein NDU88_004483 [Pleurodeles waltl]|uniref:Uncharacterized protein n=1 Tax=Pleurodeles waltl TaxID=8319 RepID=A0AAV7TS43_PLEWA|nr:hypothetical protein NDU88_004483 [Pleurodeles waltl]